MKKYLLLFLFLVSTVLFSSDGKIWTEGRGTFSKAPTINLPDFSPLVEALEDSVVNIYTTQLRADSSFGDPEFRDLFEFFFQGPQGGTRPPQRRSQSLGTGFIINQDGYILTNYHVVKNSDVISIKFARSDTYGSKGYEAKLIGRDPELDIALLKVDTKKKLKVAPLGDSNKSKTGEWVVAMGNPLGLGHTVTKGIITGKQRVIGTGAYDDYIQTDASINPGNSGGPLFNLKGEVVGINTAIIAGAQGVGFAIPINLVKDILPQLATKGSASRGFIGIGSQPLTEDLKKELGFPLNRNGVLIASVEPGFPAESSGVKPGDIVVSFNNNPTETPVMLSIAVGRTPVGKTVPMSVFRKEKTITLNVTLTEREQQKKLLGRETLHGRKAEDNEKVEKVETLLGMKMVPNTKALRQRYKLPYDKGVLVIEVQVDSAAHDAGIERGDIIDSIDGDSVNSISDVKSKFSRNKNSYILRIRRDMGYFFTSIRKK